MQGEGGRGGQQVNCTTCSWSTCWLSPTIKKACFASVCSYFSMIHESNISCKSNLSLNLERGSQFIPTCMHAVLIT